MVVVEGHDRDADAVWVDDIAEIPLQLHKLNLVNVCRPAVKRATKAPANLKVARRDGNRASDPGLRVVVIGSEAPRMNGAVFLEAMPAFAARINFAKVNTHAAPFRINPKGEQARTSDLGQQHRLHRRIVLGAAKVHKQRAAAGLELAGADAPVFRGFKGEVQGAIVKGVGIFVPAQILLGHRAGAAAVAGNAARAVGGADGVNPEFGTHGQGIRPLRGACGEEAAAAFARRQNCRDEGCAIVFRTLDQQCVARQRLIQRERHHDAV